MSANRNTLANTVPEPTFVLDGRAPAFIIVELGDRLTIATTIERLINLLDDLDGDPDLEAGCDDEDVNEDGREDSTDAGATEHGIADIGGVMEQRGATRAVREGVL